MPPPEFHLETWKDSLECLRRESVDHIALTHFGIYDDYQNHLRSLNDQLTKNETWLEKMMAANPSEERFQTLYIAFVKQQYLEYGISDIRAKVYETVNPSYMSAAGIMRYWKKNRENHG